MPKDKLVSIRFINPIVFVKDVNISKEFYTQVVGLEVVQDHGAFVLFQDHFSIHQARELTVTVWGEDAPETDQTQGRRNLLLYFETPDLEQVFNRICDRVELIHPIQIQAWGQKVFRLYDPDHHVVEIGEPL